MDSRMSDRDNELIAAAAQHAQRQALEIARDEYDNVVKTLNSQLAKGDSAGAAWTMHTLADVVSRANLIAGHTPTQQQQAQQQPQQPYTQAEQDLMREYPDEIRRNWNTALTAHNNLLASKRAADPEADLWAYRNSREYIQGIAHACGVLNSDGTESNEGPLSPNMVCEICKIDADTYNRGVQRLIEDKRAGKYPMGQT
jgi:hypothetical protein